MELRVRNLYINQNKSLPDISEILNISIYKARKILLGLNVKLRTRSEGINLARHKLGKHCKGKKRIFTEQHKQNIRKAALNRKGCKGISLKSNGYYVFTTGINKDRGVHTVIMESYIGRKLIKNEVVHHINHIKTDNRIENLRLMTKSKHSSLHAKLIKRSKDSKGRFI